MISAVVRDANRLSYREFGLQDIRDPVLLDTIEMMFSLYNINLDGKMESLSLPYGFLYCRDKIHYPPLPSQSQTSQAGYIVMNKKHGKLLQELKGTTSRHYHKTKIEIFINLRGRITLEVWYANQHATYDEVKELVNSTKPEIITLERGTLELPTYTVHKLKALEPALTAIQIIPLPLSWEDHHYV